MGVTLDKNDKENIGEILIKLTTLHVLERCVRNIN